MRILALPRYGSMGASSRLRSYQYFPWLRQYGIDVHCVPLFRDEYLKSLYASKRDYYSIFSGYLRRLQALSKSRDFDVLFVEKEFLPWVPAILESSLVRSDIRLVIDYDDAVFHNYDLHRWPIVRAVLGKKLDHLMARADMVIAGNDYLAERAITAGCRRVERVPTVIDLDRYVLTPRSRWNDDRLVIGWIGSPSTTKYLGAVSAALESLKQRHKIRCVAVGAQAAQLYGTPFEAISWEESSEVFLLQSFDIGIMPLPDTPWAQGKCGYKLIQYMACGLPVVASAVGVNSNIIRSGENGFLVDDLSGWEGCIEKLIGDASLRARLGAAGRERVEREFCLQVQAPRLAKLLLDLY